MITFLITLSATLKGEHPSHALARHDLRVSARRGRRATARQIDAAMDARIALPSMAL